MARVLHIEDDPANRRLVRKLLATAGHDVIDAASGIEGVRLASAQRPDLVLVDINVPDLDGYEVTLRLRSIAELERVPIVAITAEGDRETSLAVGCDGFLEKPIDARRFASTIEQFLNGRRERVDEAGTNLLRERTQKIVERLERKVLELSEANARLEEVAGLRREFLRNVTHELATPMTPVVGYLKLLLDEEVGKLTPLQRRCLESIDESTQRLRRVIDTLLDVSSVETGRMHFYEREYDAAALARTAVAEARRRAKELGLGLVADVSKDEVPMVGDPEKLGRAFQHVVDNALKFTPVEGRVAIELRRSPREAELLVADSGPGIPPEGLPRIFEPFFQVDGSVTRSHGGAGLGLAFAKHVVEASGGRIEVESPPSEAVAGETLPGTLVRIRLPVKPA